MVAKEIAKNVAIYSLPALAVGGAIGWFMKSRQVKKAAAEKRLDPSTGEVKKAA